MELSVLNTSGKDTGKKVTLTDTVFAVEPNDHAIYLDVKQYLANQRQGTHAAKERADIVGSTKKIKRQKGTGTARAGSIKSPIFRGGGRVFGPRPRNYDMKLNKKLKQVARRSALSYKAQENAIAVIEDIVMDAPKTKEYISLMDNLSLGAKKTLIVTDELNKNLILSSRNVQNSAVTVLSELNTYDILNADNIIFSEGTIDKLENQFG
ncbi:MAG: 50S ribosomal protein L4 [bacterium]|nr:50S ribosomal protein L4 [bacterium]